MFDRGGCVEGPCLVPRLMLVGGADKPHQVDIYQSFLWLAAQWKNQEPQVSEFFANMEGTIATKGHSPRIGVVTLASEDPQGSFDAIRVKLEPHGLGSLVHLWADYPSKPLEPSQLLDLHGIWFTGGDQARIMEALKAGGLVSVIQDMVYGRHEGYQGYLAMGGTSAGAAIMCDPILLGGDPFLALKDPSTGLVWGRGCGVFIHGMVDQHVDQRGRYGRIIAGLASRSQDFPGGIGVGVGENTGLMVLGDQGYVVGSSGVHIFETMNMLYNPAIPSYQNIEYHYLEAGDYFDFLTKEAHFPQKTRLEPIHNDEYRRLSASSCMSPHPGLGITAARMVLDNADLPASGLQSLLVEPVVQDQKRATTPTTTWNPTSFQGFLVTLRSKVHPSPGAWYHPRGSWGATGIIIDIMGLETFNIRGAAGDAP